MEATSTHVAHVLHRGQSRCVTGAPSALLTAVWATQYDNNFATGWTITAAPDGAPTDAIDVGLFLREIDAPRMPTWLLRHLGATMTQPPGIASVMQQIDAAVGDVRRHRKDQTRTA